MCTQCQPFYQASSSSFAPIGLERRVRISSQDFDVYEDLLGTSCVPPGAISNSPARREEASTRPSRSVHLEFQDGPTRLRKTSTRGMSCEAYEAQFAAEEVVASAPGLPQFLRIASDAGWRSTHPLGRNLSESTKSQITDEFLKLVSQHLKAWADNHPGYDWANDPRLRAHAPRTIAKIVELQADPDSILNQPGSTYSADLQTVIVTTKDGKVTLFDTSKQTKTAPFGDPEDSTTRSSKGKGAPDLFGRGNGSITACMKYTNPFLLSAAVATEEPATEPLPLQDGAVTKCLRGESSLRIKRAAARQHCGGRRDSFLPDTTTEDAETVGEVHNLRPSPSKPKDEERRIICSKPAPYRVGKTTKMKNKTPTMKDAEGKTSKTASPKKAAASPKKATASPKKDKEPMKAKPRAAGKGKAKDAETAAASDKEGTATPSPSGRSLRVRK